MTQRKNSSRSKELDIVLGEFKDQKNRLKQYLTFNHEGGTFLCEDKSFTYGNISRIVNHIDWSNDISSQPINNVSKIFHLDSLSKDYKRLIFFQNEIPYNILGTKFKPDLLVIDISRNYYLISFKDGTSITKLGQVSAKIDYHLASLKGGHLVSRFDSRKIVFPRELTFRNTELTSEQFSVYKKKLSYRMG